MTQANPIVQGFFDAATATISYVHEAESRKAAIIVAEDDFVRMRKARDATLGAPALILPSLQVNFCGGRLPPPAANGIRYLRLPLNQIGRSEAS